MAISVAEIVPFTHARANLSALVEGAMQGTETIITKDGRPAAALIDAQKLDHYHRLENSAIHMMWLNEAEKGLPNKAALWPNLLRPHPRTLPCALPPI